MGCVTTSSAVARQKSTIDGVYHPWTVGYQKKSLLVTGPFSYAGDVYIYIHIIHINWIKLGTINWGTCACWSAALILTHKWLEESRAMKPHTWAMQNDQTPTAFRIGQGAHLPMQRWHSCVLGRRHGMSREEARLGMSEAKPRPPFPGSPERWQW